ncbi:MAG: large subunit ribosomal protein L35 [Parcubacteria group bacterium Greene0714_21]|nr:MAG: large subunit ribosomal protein L35 [Parcubacteria group bacterium Greene0416_39]TSC97335.1 MAG: large subunit ribosomal protein L35 [Parcubacteria group bacterium Greene1014_47]TSD03938.1 MAG: large subunit ribosomal protein L35 [Parcubacteria group bacterium Greene0714_21]
MKTRKSITKRFKLTKRGKLLRRVAGHDHALAKKSSKSKRRMRRWIEVSPYEAKVIRKMSTY